MSAGDVTEEQTATPQEIDDAIEYIKAAWGTGHRFYRSLCTLRAEVAALRRQVEELRAPSADVVTVKGDLPEGDKPTPEFMENYVDAFDPGERSAALFGWREGRRDLRAKFHALRSGEAGTKEGA